MYLVQEQDTQQVQQEKLSPKRGQNVRVKQYFSWFQLLYYIGGYKSDCGDRYTLPESQTTFLSLSFSLMHTLCFYCSLAQAISCLLSAFHAAFYWQIKVFHLVGSHMGRLKLKELQKKIQKICGKLLQQKYVPFLIVNAIEETLVSVKKQ